MAPPWLPLLASAVTVRGPSLCWFDEVVAPQAVQYDERGGLEHPEAVVELVTGLLYKLFYCAGAPVLWGSYNSRVSGAPDRGIADLLHSANAGRGRAETDWRYVGPSRDTPGGAVVEKDGLRLTVPEPAGTDPLTVTVPPGSFARSQGFYVAHGDAPLSFDGPLSRLYLNAAYPSAGQLMHLVTTVLNEHRFAFDFKIANNCRGFHRCDNSVLYFPRRGLSDLAQLLFPHLIEAGRRGYLGQATPALTCRLAPGVAAADDPKNGDSFGHHRCQVIAHGIVTTLTSEDLELRERAIRSAFARSDLDIHHPYLNDPSIDPYARYRSQSPAPAAESTA